MNLGFLSEVNYAGDLVI